MINQSESCASMDTNSNAITCRAIKSWLMFCAAARAGNHAFKGVSSFRRPNLCSLADGRDRSGSQSSYQQRQCKCYCRPQQDDFDPYVQAVPYAFSLHVHTPAASQSQMPGSAEEASHVSKHMICHS